MRKSLCRWFGLMTIEDHERGISAWRSTAAAFRALIPGGVVTICGGMADMSDHIGGVVVIDGENIRVSNLSLTTSLIVMPDSANTHITGVCLVQPK